MDLAPLKAAISVAGNQQERLKYKTPKPDGKESIKRTQRKGKHRVRPTVKKRLQVCSGIHLCFWNLSGSVLGRNEGFHQLYHEV